MVNEKQMYKYRGYLHCNYRERRNTIPKRKHITRKLPLVDSVKAIRMIYMLGYELAISGGKPEPEPEAGSQQPAARSRKPRILSVAQDGISRIS